MKKFVLLSTTFVLAFSASAGLYRWVDEAGNVHFSDKVPAAASKKTHTKLTKDGALKKTVDPTSLQHEQETMELLALEKEKEEELRKIKQEALMVIKRRDDYLLSTYENKFELMHSFESKIKMLEGNSKILEAQNTVLNKKIVKLENKKKKATPASKETIDKKIKNIVSTIEQYKKALSENEKQITKLTTDYKTDMQRYIEITQ